MCGRYTLTRAWLVNGTTIAASTGTLDDSAFARRCGALPRDGMVTGVSLLSNTVTVVNTAPTVGTTTLGPSARARHRP